MAIYKDREECMEKEGYGRTKFYELKKLGEIIQLEDGSVLTGEDTEKYIKSTEEKENIQINQKEEYKKILEELNNAKVELIRTISETEKLKKVIEEKDKIIGLKEQIERSDKEKIKELKEDKERLILQNDKIQNGRDHLQALLEKNIISEKGKEKGVLRIAFDKLFKKEEK